MKTIRKAIGLFAVASLLVAAAALIIDGHEVNLADAPFVEHERNLASVPVIDGHEINLAEAPGTFGSEVRGEAPAAYGSEIRG